MVSAPPDRALRSRRPDATCLDGGWLVGPEVPLSPHAADHVGSRRGPPQGCNHLVCGRCQADVQSTIQPGGRRYACACEAVTTDQILALHDPDDWPHQGPPAWACAGHPALDVPFLLDGVRVDPAEVEALVDATLAGGPPGPLADAFPAAWLLRVLGLLPSEHRGALSRAVARRLTDPVRRAAALDLLRRAPDAEDGGALAGWVASGDDALDDPDLAPMLQVALADRLPSTRDAAWGLLTRVAVRPVLLEALVADDPARVVAELPGLLVRAPDDALEGVLVELRPLAADHGEAVRVAWCATGRPFPGWR